MINMSNTPSSLRHLQRLAARAHIGSLLVLLSACSGAPVSLGSGIDDQESALTDTPSGSSMDPNEMAVDCATNPLGDGCPTAGEDCATNPLGDGCPTADEMAVDCGQLVNDCYADAMTNGADPARCEMLRGACPQGSGSPEPSMGN